ncbi:hypothetical protein [Photobacterium damselae]|uniref:hypothetical protein n=1 Tax=Photobacterium damselae TaxID=38293 RepID=UPI004068EB94
MKKQKSIDEALKSAVMTISLYNKKLVDFETNIMLFDDGNIIKNTNELTIMRSSLNDDITLLSSLLIEHDCTLEQYCKERELEYEYNEFSVQRKIMQDLLNSIDKTNNQINECVTSIFKNDQTNDSAPTSIRRRARHAKLKKTK